MNREGQAKEEKQRKINVKRQANAKNKDEMAKTNFASYKSAPPRFYQADYGLDGSTFKAETEESLIFGRNARITCNSFVEKHCLIIFT